MLMECAAMQELLGVKPVWWAAGSKEYPLSLQTLTALEFLLLGALELRRYQGWKATKQVHLGHALYRCLRADSQFSRAYAAWEPAAAMHR